MYNNVCNIAEIPSLRTETGSSSSSNTTSFKFILYYNDMTSSSFIERG